jgi:hypothetical protein
VPLRPAGEEDAAAEQVGVSASVQDSSSSATASSSTEVTDRHHRKCDRASLTVFPAVLVSNFGRREAVGEGYREGVQGWLPALLLPKTLSTLLEPLSA